MADVMLQASLLCYISSTSWVREVILNVVAGMLEVLNFATHTEVDAQEDQELSAWEDLSARPLLQQSLQASLLTPRNARPVATQMLENPATMQKLTQPIGKAVATYIQTISVTHKSKELPK